MLMPLTPWNGVQRFISSLKPWDIPASLLYKGIQLYFVRPSVVIRQRLLLDECDHVLNQYLTAEQFLLLPRDLVLLIPVVPDTYSRALLIELDS